MSLDKSPKFYYFLTQQDMGDEPTLKPRKSGDNRGDDEPLTARICVAPSVPGCLTALGSCLDLAPAIHVYVTKEQVMAHNPRHVHDSHITGEMWLKKQTAFRRVGIIDPKDLPEDLWDIFMPSWDSVQCFKIQKRVLSKLQRQDLGNNLVKSC
jgi:hypothetical protein